MSELAKQRGGNTDLIFDADLHVNDTPAALAPHCASAWRRSLEQLATLPPRYLDIPGFAPSIGLDPPIPGMHPMRSVNSPAEMRAGLDAIGVAGGVLLPDNLLLFALLPHAEYAVAVGQAYNRWLRDEWLAEEHGLFGAVLAFPQDPHAAAREIEQYAAHERVVAVYLPTAAVAPLWGDRKYDPIFAAAQEAGLPVVLHSVTVVAPRFPCQFDQFENHFARQVVGHAFAMQANLTSLIHTGVPVRFPRLKIVFTEAGLAWVPYMMWRMDKYHAEYRRMVPILARRPSEYIRERMWFSTQPIEEPERPADLVETIRHLGGAERVLFASDWPHHDFDHPRIVQRLPLEAWEKRRIMGANALEVFRLPATSALHAAQEVEVADG